MILFPGRQSPRLKGMIQCPKCGERFVAAPATALIAKTVQTLGIAVAVVVAYQLTLRCVVHEYDGDELRDVGLLIGNIAAVLITALGGGAVIKKIRGSATGGSE